VTTRRDFLGQSTAAVLAATGSGRILRATRAGLVQTVLGPVDSGKLGYTLPHEHIAASSTGFMQAWPEFFGGREKFVELVVEKLKTAKKEGVGTIVDVTPIDVGRDMIRCVIGDQEQIARGIAGDVGPGGAHWPNSGARRARKAARPSAKSDEAKQAAEGAEQGGGGMAQGVAYAMVLTELTTQLSELEALGVQLKDFERGLIDFPSMRDGRVILLCWQLGEGDELEWWHDVDAGFAGRTPL